MDVYCEKGVDTVQPTIISIHGGGWVYGDKERYQYYCMDLAQRGFTVVNFTYRLAPEFVFPAALEDINAVFQWVAQNGAKYRIDTDKVFVVGDSAGAQLASQYLTIFTSEEYRRQFSVDVPSDKVTVRAVALNCGMYEAEAMMKEEMAHVFHLNIRMDQAKQCNDEECQFFCRILEK